MIRRIAMVVLVLAASAMPAGSAQRPAPGTPTTGEPSRRDGRLRHKARIASLMRELARLRQDAAREQDPGRRAAAADAIRRGEERLEAARREERWHRRGPPRRLPPPPVHTRR